MHEFELPSNIKQIGSISDGLKIYMEDYVITYLKQYADSGGHCEKIAFLVGKYIIIDSRPYLFISGAIQGRHTEFEDGAESFTEKSYAYAQEQIDTFFNGYEIVGWMQSQPGYGIVLNQTYGDFHMANFTRPHHVLFVIDPVERINSFYIWNDSKTGLKEATGYFIYYDKNNGMQEYMLENRITRLSMREKVATEKTDTPPVSLKTRQRKENEAREESVNLEKAEKRTDNTEYRRVINMLVSLSAVLFVICFIMGAGLIQNDGRLNRLEKNITALDSAYNYLTATNKSGTQSVFAGQSDTTEPVIEDEDETSGDVETSTEEYPELDLANTGENETVQSLESEATEVAETITAEESAQPTESETPVVSDNDTQSNVDTNNSDTEVSENSVDVVTDTIPETYVVQKGDSLIYISKKFYGTTDMVDEILALNNMEDPDTIFFGKILMMPQK